MKFLLYAASLFFLMACGNSKAPEAKPSGKKTTASANNISFQVNGEPVNTSGWNISRFESGHHVGMNITTNMHEDKRTVSININGDHTGTYTLNTGSRGDGTGYGSYRPDYNDLLNSYSFTDGELVVTKIDAVSGSIDATFHGRAKKGNEVINITEGKISNGKLTAGVTKYD